MATYTVTLALTDLQERALRNRKTREGRDAVPGRGDADEPGDGRPEGVAALAMRRVLTSGLVLIVALGLAGCVEIVALAFSTAIGATGVYQRLEDRKTQKDQNEAIRELREELAP